MNKKVIIIGGGVGITPKLRDAIVNSIEMDNDNVVLVKVGDNNQPIRDLTVDENQEVRALATELVELERLKIRETLFIDGCHRIHSGMIVNDIVKSEKELSQQGWKNRPKYKR
jgi:hypothetical protein